MKKTYIIPETCIVDFEANRVILLDTSLTGATNSKATYSKESEDDYEYDSNGY